MSNINIILRVFVYSVSIATISMVLITLIQSIFYGYHITIFTNNYGECWFEIILILFSLFGLIYVLYKDFISKLKIKYKKIRGFTDEWILKQADDLGLNVGFVKIK